MSHLAGARPDAAMPEWRRASQAHGTLRDVSDVTAAWRGLTAARGLAHPPCSRHLTGQNRAWWLIRRPALPIFSTLNCHGPPTDGKRLDSTRPHLEALLPRNPLSSLHRQARAVKTRKTLFPPCSLLSLGRVRTRCQSVVSRLVKLIIPASSLGIIIIHSTSRCPIPTSSRHARQPVTDRPTPYDSEAGTPRTRPAVP